MFSNIRYCFIFIILLINSTISSTHNFNTINNCQIRSKKLKFDFLINTKSTNESLTHSSNVFTLPLAKIENMNVMLWSIKPIFKQQNTTSSFNIDSNNVYYIINYDNNEYICATNRFQKMLITRIKLLDTNKRLLHTFENKHLKENGKKCLWRFEKSSILQRNYYILVQSNSPKKIKIYPIFW
jgi:hypothetical protein